MTSIDKNFDNNLNKQMPQGEKKPLSLEERLDKLFAKCKEAFVSELDRRLPQNGTFAQIGTALKIPGTNNVAILIISADSEDPKEKRNLQVGVKHQNSDRLISNYILNGTKQEIIDYLSNKKNDEEIKFLIKTLSKETDRYYSSL